MATPRIVILTHDQDRHFYFCNRIIEATGGVVGVITGGKHVRRSRGETWRRRLRRSEAPYYVRNKLANLAFRPYGKKFWNEKQERERHYFAGSADRFRQRHAELLAGHVDASYRSVNHKDWIDRVRALKPDVIAVMGTCLLGKRMIRSAEHVLNMHTGLSPYYRGGQTNMWPILEDDYGYFGVTVHRMSLGIDSGNIVFTARPEVEESDTYTDINSKCIQLGVELMIRAVEDIGNGRSDSVKQWTRGKLFLDRDLNHYVAYRYFKRRPEFMKTYCRLVREQRLPQPRLVG